MTHVLVLGGTAEARDLAAQLAAKGVTLTSSLAGRVSKPRLPVGPVRIGGFGGVDGLVEWITEHDVSAVVDATHPFAQTMGSHAAQACAQVDVPLLRLARPGWTDHPDAARWTWVEGHVAAREAADALGRAPFVTTGRQTLHHHVGAWADRDVLVRLVEPHEDPLPQPWTVLRSRGPFDVAGEETLMREHGVDVLLTKDSGGSFTAAKLTAAATLGIPVVVVARPARADGVEQVSDAGAAADWVDQVLSGRPRRPSGRRLPRA
ncbi:cobalt-precorrin-6A reductase [Janibacter cremeus]|uniref:Precorrin-6A/cobalt-precorrin-6A reductase n=1 Tax=Janibacter cremeus TaxID=1285192 RepID=A0A852VU97_9MICO|nr:cobalt-precorrin-6A reductase [Janibacter cremeus]NYF97141.1 precorrin-6A/cobalt-precorrin-6A reductase [Janibacter cremeus]